MLVRWLTAYLPPVLGLLNWHRHLPAPRRPSQWEGQDLVHPLVKNLLLAGFVDHILRFLSLPIHSVGAYAANLGFVDSSSLKVWHLNTTLKSLHGSGPPFLFSFHLKLGNEQTCLAQFQIYVNIANSGVNLSIIGLVFYHAFPLWQREEQPSIGVL